MSVHERLIKIFEYALNQEETGKRFFQHSLKRMGVGAAVSAFKRLIEEEEKHILFIKGILANLREKGEIELPSEKGARPGRPSRCYQRGKRATNGFSVSTAINSPTLTPRCRGAVNLPAEIGLQ